MREVYHPKVLLFGEYSVLAGSRALTVPLTTFSASWAFVSEANDKRQAVASNKSLQHFYQYLCSHERFAEILNLNALQEALQYGLYLHSNIPLGYGLGSSGAVVAAVFERFAKDDIQKYFSQEDHLSELRQILADMEAFYHGTSSGTDPLAIFINKPLHIENDKITIAGNIQVFNTIIPALHDLGIVSETGLLVNQTLENWKSDKHKSNPLNAYITIVDQCIDNALNNNVKAFWESLHELTTQQLAIFPELLTANGTTFLKNGLKNHTYYAKLCGSGGGGFMLFFTSDKNLLVDHICVKV